MTADLFHPIPPVYDVILSGTYFCDLIFTGLPELPRLGLDLFGKGFDILPGGAYNSALELHRLGLKSAWVCDFGDDLFSRFVLEQSAADGLDASLFQLHSFPVRRISAAFSYPHDRGFISFKDEDPATPIADLVRRCRPRWVLLSHLHYRPEDGDIFAAAVEVGAEIYMDCQYTPATLENPAVIDALRRVQVFAPNCSEAMHLTGASDAGSALALLAEFAPTVIVKMGGEGAIASEGGKVVHSPALKLDIVDTTGSGDCFNAGFLYARLHGMGLEDSLRCGNFCGGTAATARGNQAAPTAAQLEEYLRTT